jgi:uncharacterized protein (DUF58 family)
MKHRQRRFEITLAGLVFVAVALFVLLATINSQSNLLFFAWGLMLGSLLVSALIGAVMLRGVSAQRQTSDHAEAGQPTEVQYEITNSKHRWPCFALHLTEAFFHGRLDIVPEGYCLHVGPGQTARVVAYLQAPERGIVELQDLRFSCAFPFGFLRRAIHLLRPQRIVIYPRIGSVSRELALRCRQVATGGLNSTELRGGQDEFFGLRDYRPGDSVRSIHWRRTARTGEIKVREMTSDAPPRLMIVLNLRNWRAYTDGRSRAERAIELAAALVCHGFQVDYSVGLCIAGQQYQPPRSGREQRAALLEALALVNLAHCQEAGLSSEPSELRIATDQASGDATFSGLGPRDHGACWLVVTLGQSDRISDIVPGATPGREAGPGSAGLAGALVLALDAPDSAGWIHFATSERRAAAPVTTTP